jgi:hypothetical protein
MPALVPDLEARFVRHEVRVTKTWHVRPEVAAERPEGPYNENDLFEKEGPQVHIVHVDTLAEAQGVWFLCPLCFAKNGGRVGTHAVCCWFVGQVPDDIEPKPGRWTPHGTGLHDLTFVPSDGRTQSVALTGGCAWHGHVVNGSAA